MTVVAKSTEISRNIAIHDRIAKKYDRLHGEIFNEVEQARLKRDLERAVAAIASGSRCALDVGCGSGNLTRHLLENECVVTAADVSQGFLDLVRSRHPAVETHRLNGADLSEMPDGTFDLVAAYSVLHHIPDYLAAIREMGRVCKPGGVLYLDHEPSEGYWAANPAYQTFRRRALRIDWRKYLTPLNYLHRLRSIGNPRYSNEGDIHVWPDDHVEWPKVVAALPDFEILVSDDYLLYRALYRREVYEEAKGLLSDMRVMIMRKLC